MPPIFHNIIFFVAVLWCLASCLPLAFPDRALLRRLRLREKKRKRNQAKGPHSAEGSKVVSEADFSKNDRRKERLRGGVSLAVGVLVLVLLRPDAGFKAAGVTGASTNTELESLVIREAESFMDRQPILGMVAAVVHGDESFVLGFGRRDLSTKESPDGDTVYELASLSKLFTGLLLAHEIEQGAVSLDDPVSQHLPKGVSLPDSTEELLIRHLATHTSGFPKNPENLKKMGSLAGYATGRSPYKGYTEQHFWEAVETLPLRSQPGEKVFYSNFGASLLASLMANKRNTTFESRTREVLCHPLGMKDTCVNPSEEQQTRRARNYRSIIKLGGFHITLGADPWRVPDTMAGEGGLLSTGNDMLKFLQANIGQPQSVLSKTITAAQQELHPWTDNMSLGMLWFRTKREDHVLLQHEGRSTGQRSFIGVIEGQPTGIVLLSNGQVEVDNLGKRLLRQMLRLDSAATPSLRANNVNSPHTESSQ